MEKILKLIRITIVIVYFIFHIILEESGDPIPPEIYFSYPVIFLYYLSGLTFYILFPVLFFWRCKHCKEKIGVIFSKKVCPHCNASVSELNILFRLVLSGIAAIEFSTTFIFFILESLFQSILLFIGLLLIIGVLELLRINTLRRSAASDQVAGQVGPN